MPERVPEGRRIGLLKPPFPTDSQTLGGMSIMERHVLHKQSKYCSVVQVRTDCHAAMVRHQCTTYTSDSSSGCGLGLILEQLLHESDQFAYVKRFFHCAQGTQLFSNIEEVKVEFLLGPGHGDYFDRRKPAS